MAGDAQLGVPQLGDFTLSETGTEQGIFGVNVDVFDASESVVLSGGGGKSLELQTQTTIPGSSTIDITIYEDSSGNGTANHSQQVSLSGGSETNTLTGFNAQPTNIYWAEMDITRPSTGEDPFVDAIELVLINDVTGSIAAPSVNVLQADEEVAASAASIFLETTASIPAGSSIDVTVYEDIDGNGTADNSQQLSISDGTQTQILTGFEAESTNIYWAEIDISRSTTGEDPFVDAIEIYLSDEDVSFYAIQNSTILEAQTEIDSSEDAELAAPSVSVMEAETSIGVKRTPSILSIFSNILTPVLKTLRATNTGINSVLHRNVGENEPTCPNDGVNSSDVPSSGGINSVTNRNVGENAPTVDTAGVTTPDTNPQGGVNSVTLGLTAQNAVVLPNDGKLEL